LPKILFGEILRSCLLVESPKEKDARDLGATALELANGGLMCRVLRTKPSPKTLKHYLTKKS